MNQHLFVTTAIVYGWIATEYFYGCLSNAHGEKLAPYINNEFLLTEKLKGLLLLKQPAKFHGSELSMRNIGG